MSGRICCSRRPPRAAPPPGALLGARLFPGGCCAVHETIDHAAGGSAHGRNRGEKLLCGCTIGCKHILVRKDLALVDAVHNPCCPSIMAPCLPAAHHLAAMAVHRLHSCHTVVVVGALGYRCLCGIQCCSGMTIRQQGHPCGVPCAQVMRHMAEGVVAFLLKRHDHAKPILRAASRELLSSCVLRSLMTFFTPYTANKVRGVFCHPVQCAHASHVAAISLGSNFCWQ